MEIDNVKTIVETAQNAVETQMIELSDSSVREAKLFIVSRPDGSGKVSLQSVKPFLDEYRTRPERRKGSAKVNTIASLIDLTNRHKDEDSVVFADIDAAAPSVFAVFDYHQKDLSPRYGAHRAVYSFPLSDEWKAWLTKDAASMTQGDWAAFIEDHIADLASPTDGERSEYERLFSTKIAAPSELITLSRGLQISVESKVRDFRTLQSGEVEISYEEVHKDGSGQKLVVPGLFVLNIPLFVDAERTRILARLRYRKANSSVVWFYQLYRAKQELRAAMRLEAEKVASETGLPVFEGTPET